MGKSKQTSKTSSSTNQTQTNTPYAPAQPGLTNLAQLTNQAMLQAQAVPQYQGDFVALPGALQQQVIPAYQASAALAGSLIDPALQAANQTNWQMPTFGGPSINQGTQTFGSYDASQVAPVVEAAIQPYLRQLTEQILPGLQSSAIESGAYSNDRAFAVMPQQALRDTSRMASEVGAGIAFQDFLNQQQRLQNAYQMSTQRGLGEADVLTSRLSMYPELLDTAMRLSTGQGDLLNSAAAYDLAMRQSEINNSLAQDAYNVQAPYRGLDMAAQILGTFSPYATQNMVGKTNSTTTTTQQQPLAGQLLQGAIGLGSMFAGFPGLGTALGIGSQVANPLMGMTGGATSAFSNPFSYLFKNTPLGGFGV
jgi:hypothetical protein